MKINFVALMGAITLCGGCSNISVEPNEMGASQDCAQNSASLSQYNQCTEQVETFYRDYEQEKRMSEKDGG